MNLLTSSVATEPHHWHLISTLLAPIATRQTESSPHQHWMRKKSHAHIYPEILFALEGKCPYGYHSRLLNVTPGTVILFAPGEPHDGMYPPEGPPFCHLWFTLHRTRYIGHMIRRRGDRLEHSLRFRGNLSSAAALIDRLYAPPAVDSEDDTAVLRLELVQAVAEMLVRAITVHDTGERDESFQERVIYTIQQHLDETGGAGETLDTLARLAGYDKYHFCRLFKQFTGLTVHQYVDQCRWEIFRRMRRDGCMHKEISQRLGFSAPSSFARWLQQQKTKADR